MIPPRHGPALTSVKVHMLDTFADGGGATRFWIAWGGFLAMGKLSETSESDRNPEPEGNT